MPRLVVTFRNELAVSGQLLVAASGQITMAAHTGLAREGDLRRAPRSGPDFAGEFWPHLAVSF